MIAFLLFLGIMTYSLLAVWFIISGFLYLTHPRLAGSGLGVILIGTGLIMLIGVVRYIISL